MKSLYVSQSFPFVLVSNIFSFHFCFRHPLNERKIKILYVSLNNKTIRNERKKDNNNNIKWDCVKKIYFILNFRSRFFCYAVNFNSFSNKWNLVEIKNLPALSAQHSIQSKKKKRNENLIFKNETNKQKQNSKFYYNRLKLNRPIFFVLSFCFKGRKKNQFFASDDRVFSFPSSVCLIIIIIITSCVQKF